MNMETQNMQGEAQTNLDTLSAAAADTSSVTVHRIQQIPVDSGE